MRKTVFIIGVLAVGISSCKKDKTPVIVENEECPTMISYANQVEPIINSGCAVSGCHDASSVAAGYDLSTHANVSANSSIILNVIRHDAGVTPMPIGGSKLADSTIAHFECWVSQGALDN